MVSAGHVVGTCGAGIVSSIYDMLGMRGVGGVCEMCLSRGSVGRGGERIGFVLYQSCWNSGSVGCVFGLRWCRGL